MPAGCVQNSELSAFGKAKTVSTFQQRRRLRDLTVSVPKDDVEPVIRSTQKPLDEFLRRQRHSDWGDAGSGLAGDSHTGCRQLLRPAQFRPVGLHVARGARGHAVGHCTGLDLAAVRRRRGGRFLLSIRRSTLSGFANPQNVVDLAPVSCWWRRSPAISRHASRRRRSSSAGAKKRSRNSTPFRKASPPVLPAAI